MSDQLSPWSRLRGLELVSLCDWPGRVSAVLFLGGCDLRCPTCHNAALAWTPETLPAISEADAVRLLEAERDWLDGLVVTGGEATLSPDLPKWLSDLRERFGLPIKLDTNAMRPDVVAACLARGATDLVAVDVKGPFSKYPLLTGGRADAEQAAVCLERIFGLAATFPDRFMFRCTAVPQLTPEDIGHVRSLLPTGFALTIQPYSPVRISNSEV